MKAKAWLTIFTVFALLIIGGAAFLCFTTSKGYSNARANWDRNLSTIESLGKKKPYPSQENVQQLEKLKKEYEQAVAGLFKGLNQFQQDLNLSLVNTQFQQLVSDTTLEFRNTASGANFKIEVDEFQLGFDAYSNSVPTQEIVPILDYELKAIDHLLRTLMTSGAESMDHFSRDLIPGEVGGPERQEISVVHKYPVRIGFRSSHPSYREFINKISNDKEYFYILRVLKVVNDVTEGPLKAGGDEATFGGLPIYEDPETGQIGDQDMLKKWGYPNKQGAELDAAAAEDGFFPSGKDARVLMGQEKLNVFAVVDIVRFLDPAEVAKETPSRSNSSSSRRRRSN